MLKVLALLGIQRNKMVYQDESTDLRNSYFGLGKDSKFPSKEQQLMLKQRPTE